MKKTEKEEVLREEPQEVKVYDISDFKRDADVFMTKMEKSASKAVERVTELAMMIAM